jgi:hypothetical protein
MDNFIEGLKKQKEYNNILSGSIIDMQAYVKLAPQVFAENASTSPDFESACDCLRNLCNEIKTNIAKVAEIIPTKKVEGEIS